MIMVIVSGEARNMCVGGRQKGRERGERRERRGEGERRRWWRRRKGEKEGGGEGRVGGGRGKEGEKVATFLQRPLMFLSCSDPAIVLDSLGVEELSLL